MEGEPVRVWLVERTYSDDEQNMLILIYATLDGTRYHRKERAVPSLAAGVPDTMAALDVSPDQLGAVTDPEEQAYYADAASRTEAEYAPDEAI